MNKKSGASIEWIDPAKEKIILACLKNGKEDIILVYCNRDIEIWNSTPNSVKTPGNL